MAIIKTLNPNGLLVEIAGIPIPANISSPVEDIVDQINAALPASPPAITGNVTTGSPLAQLLVALAAAGIITNSTTLV